MPPSDAPRADGDVRPDATVLTQADWRFVPIPEPLAALVGDHPGRALFLLRLYQKARAERWNPIRVRLRGHEGLSSSEADRFLRRLIEAGYGVVERLRSGNRSEGTFVRMFDPSAKWKELKLEVAEEVLGHGRDTAGTRKRSPRAARQAGLGHGRDTAGTPTRVEPRTNVLNPVDQGREPATLPPGLDMVQKARARLLANEVAKPSSWKRLDGDALDGAILETDEALRAKCANHGVLEHELLTAVDAYTDRWYPRPQQLIDLVLDRRQRLAAEARERQREADRLAEEQQIGFPEPLPHEQLHEPAQDRWNVALDDIRRAIGREDVDTWLNQEQVHPFRISDQGRFILWCSNRYYADWIDENYREAILDAVAPAYEIERAALTLAYWWPTHA